MFDYIKNGGSINALIDEINEHENNKQSDDIMGYLTKGLYTRDMVDKQAVMTALIPLIFKEQRDTLSEHIKIKTLNNNTGE